MAQLEPPFFGSLLLGGSFVSLLVALGFGRKVRLLDDTPTSKALGVFVGEVEMEGVCTVQAPLASYLARAACVGYRWSVEEHWRRTRTESYTDSQGRSQTRTVVETGWSTVASGGELAGFYLQDETGCVWVWPEGADIDMLTLFSEEVGQGDPLYYGKGPEGGVYGSTGRRRFVEEGLPLGTKLFIRGRASERPDIVAPQIARHPEQQMFLITPRGESAVSRSKAAGYWLCHLLGFLLALGGGALLSSGRGAHVAPLSVALAGLGYLACWATGWVWMVFNSLVGLRQRVFQARSLVEVQLKRRADLIPALVAALSGYRQYEADLLPALTRLRAEAVSADTSAVSPMLTAVAERYPELRADGLFADLSRQLSDTEQRLALARNYYNDSVQFHNTRLERVPDRFVAALARMRPAEFFRAEGFERVAPAVAV